jgi:hypothetical protein
VAAHEFGQRALGVDRIPREQPLHRIGGQQFFEMPPEQRWLVGLFGPRRPLADDRLQVVHEDVEHVERTAIVNRGVEQLSGRRTGREPTSRFLQRGLVSHAR